MATPSSYGRRCARWTRPATRLDPLLIFPGLSSPFVSSSKLPSSYGRLLSSYGRLYTGGSTFPIWQAVYYMVAFAQPGAADLSHGDEAQIERLQAGA